MSIDVGNFNGTFHGIIKFCIFLEQEELLVLDCFALGSFNDPFPTIST